jgi:hypothetical protein
VDEDDCGTLVGWIILTGENRVTPNLLPVPHKSYIDWHGIESGSPRSEGGDYQPET